MKILIVSNLFPPILFGGYEILCQQVVALLRERGHCVEVLTSDFMAGSAPTEPDVHRTLKLTTDFPRPGESVGKVDFSLPGLHRVGRLNARRFEAVASRMKPDVVFCWCLSRLGSGIVLQANKMGLPVHYTINDEHPRQFRFTRQPRTVRECARAIAESLLCAATFRKAGSPRMTVISHALKSRLLRLGAPVQDAGVLHQGVDLKQFAYHPGRRGPEEPFRLLYVGQLSRAKGVHTLLEAVADLQGRWSLSVIGSGVPEYEAELRALVARHRLTDRVTFLGKQSRDEVVRAYRSHHALVFSSEWEEPFGLTHLEAMASGCAVVSTTTGGSAELIRHGQNALAYQAGSSQELAAVLGALHRDEALRRNLVSQARRYVEEHHSLHTYVDALEAWLQAGAVG